MKHKKQVLADLIWAATKYGAFQRSHIYKPNATLNSKIECRNSLKEFLHNNLFIKFYKGKLAEEDIFNITKNLIKLVKRNCSNTIETKNFTYGNAQKFVNLYSKCMWIIGILETPPHFPVDGIILKELKHKGNWTKMTFNEYKKVIKLAKAKLQNSDFKNIAEWEAETYHQLRKTASNTS